jgi:zinc protease
MAKERTANANGWVFEIIGNFDDATIRPLVCQYLGALPAKGKNPAGQRTTYPTKKNVDNTFKRKMETPKSIAEMFWMNPSLPYTQERSIEADIAGQVLSMVYLKQIREEASAAYTCGAQGVMSIADDGYHIAQLIGYCPFKPEKKDVALKIMDQAVKDLAVKCDPEMLDKVQKLMLKQHDSALKTNGYWSDIVWNDYIMHRDDHTQYADLVKAQTPEKISAFVKDFLAGANKVSVVMLPE